MTPPILPNPPSEYNQRYMDELLRVLRLFFRADTADGPLRGTTLTLLSLVGSTSLGAATDAVQTSFLLTDATMFPDQGSATVIGSLGTEKISWTGKTGNTLTGVVRGILGTTPVAHNMLDVIVASATPGAVYANPNTNALYIII